MPNVRRYAHRLREQCIYHTGLALISIPYLLGTSPFTLPFPSFAPPTFRPPLSSFPFSPQIPLLSLSLPPPLLPRSREYIYQLRCLKHCRIFQSLLAWTNYNSDLVKTQSMLRFSTNRGEHESKSSINLISYVYYIIYMYCKQQHESNKLSYIHILLHILC